MPLVIQSHQLDAQSADYFRRVLSDQPPAIDYLADVSRDHLAVEAFFNGQPVGLLVARKQTEGCQLELLVVHPATRERGVGRQLLREGMALLPRPVSWSPELQSLVEKLLDTP